MSYRARFNTLFKQDKKTSNSKSKISKLTGIPLSKLDAVYDRVLKYPATSGYTDLDFKISIHAYAMSMVYKYAIENRKR